MVQHYPSLGDHHQHVSPPVAVSCAVQHPVSHVVWADRGRSDRRQAHFTPVFAGRFGRRVSLHRHGLVVLSPGRLCLRRFRCRHGHRAGGRRSCARLHHAADPDRRRQTEIHRLLLIAARHHRPGEYEQYGRAYCPPGRRRHGLFVCPAAPGRQRLVRTGQSHPRPHHRIFRTAPERTGPRAKSSLPESRPAERTGGQQRSEGEGNP